jgi:hypothetical protein
MSTGAKTLPILMAVLLGGLLVALAPAPAAAESGPCTPPSVGILKDFLKLKPAQVQRIQTLLANYDKQHRERLEAFHSNLRSILTPQQAAQFEDMRKQRKQGQSGSKGGLRSLQEKLGLTDEQVSRIRSYSAQAREKARADHASLMAGLKSILSSDQSARFENLLRMPESHEGE